MMPLLMHTVPARIYDTLPNCCISASRKCRKRPCNDDRINIGCSHIQSLRIANSSKRLADQGRVLEGVAGKTFFFTPTRSPYNFLQLQVCMAN